MPMAWSVRLCETLGQTDGYDFMRLDTPIGRLRDQDDGVPIGRIARAVTQRHVQRAVGRD